MDRLWANQNRRRGTARPPAPQRGHPLEGDTAQKQTPSAFLGTRYATHKEGTGNMQQCIASSRRQRTQTEKPMWRRASAWESASEIRCQALCQSVRTNARRETLNREIHPQKRNHRRSVDVVPSRPKTVGVLRPKPRVCHGRDPKTQRQQRAPRQGLKLLCSRLCKGI